MGEHDPIAERQLPGDSQIQVRVQGERQWMGLQEVGGRLVCSEAPGMPAAFLQGHRDRAGSVGEPEGGSDEAPGTRICRWFPCSSLAPCSHLPYAQGPWRWLQGGMDTL